MTDTLSLQEKTVRAIQDRDLDLVPICMWDGGGSICGRRSETRCEGCGRFVCEAHFRLPECAITTATQYGDCVLDPLCFDCLEQAYIDACRRLRNLMEHMRGLQIDLAAALRAPARS